MSDFDYSDLTDIDDEEDVPLSQSQSSHKKADGDGYRIRGALTAPRATSYTTQALHEMLEQGDINLEADYQRDIVWHPTKQTGLIDSIFKNFYVPPVIFSVTYGSDGTEKRVCIDGKQRLTSIWKFMQGTIPFKDSLTGEKFYYKDNTDRLDKGKPKILPERYRKIFRTKQIVCVEYAELSPDSEREIFQRVQLGVALNAAEKLQAIHSPTSMFIRDILADFVHDDLETSLEWDTSRANDFRCVATAAYMIAKWPSKMPTMPALTKWLQEKDEPEDAFCENVRATFKIFSAMARNKEYRDVFQIEDTKSKKEEKFTKVAPAEFIAAVILVSQHKNKLTLAQLSEGILKMRLNVRANEQDIRTNTRVFGYLLKFITELKPSKLKSDNGKPAAVTGIQLYKRRAETKDVREDLSASLPGRKRKARDGDDDSDYIESRKPAPSSKKPAIRAKKESPPAPAVLTHIQASSSIQVPPPSSSQPFLPQPTPRPVSQPAQPSSLQHPTPTQFSQSTGPQIHPDRLAAIRSARATTHSPHPPEPPIGLSSRSWDGVGIRLGAGPLSHLPPGPPPPLPPVQPRNHNPDSLSQSLMSRMNMSYSIPANGFSRSSNSMTDPPYNPQRPSGFLQNGHNQVPRGPGANSWQKPW